VGNGMGPGLDRQFTALNYGSAAAPDALTQRSKRGGNGDRDAGTAADRQAGAGVPCHSRRGAPICS